MSLGSSFFFPEVLFGVLKPGKMKARVNNIRPELKSLINGVLMVFLHFHTKRYYFKKIFKRIILCERKSEKKREENGIFLANYQKSVIYNL